MRLFFRLSLTICICLFIFSLHPSSTFAQSASSNCVVTQIGNPAVSVTLPPSCPQQGGVASDCGVQLPNDINQLIQMTHTTLQFDIVGASLTQAQQTYNTFCILEKSSKFKQLFVGTLPWAQTTITFNGSNTCSEHAALDGSNHAWITVGWCGDSLNWINRFLITHEAGHIVAFRNPSLYQNYLNQVYYSSNPVYTLPTYNCQHDYGPGPWPAECWADGVGEYDSYPNYRNTYSGYPPGTPTFSQYPTQYSKQFNFVRDNLFGGTTFF